MLPTKTNFMKEIPAMRGILMMALMLISMYLVFSTVLSSDKEEDSNEGSIEEFNELIEKFDIVPPGSLDQQQPEAKTANTGTGTSTIEELDRERRDELDAQDRQQATKALMESIEKGEANRLLEAIAKPLIEKEDIRVTNEPVLPETISFSAEDILGTPQQEEPEDEN